MPKEKKFTKEISSGVLTVTCIETNETATIDFAKLHGSVKDQAVENAILRRSDAVVGGKKSGDAIKALRAAFESIENGTWTLRKSKKSIDITEKDFKEKLLAMDEDTRAKVIAALGDKYDFSKLGFTTFRK